MHLVHLMLDVNGLRPGFPMPNSFRLWPRAGTWAHREVFGLRLHCLHCRLAHLSCCKAFSPAVLLPGGIEGGAQALKASQPVSRLAELSLLACLTKISPECRRRRPPRRRQIGGLSTCTATSKKDLTQAGNKASQTWIRRRGLQKPALELEGFRVHNLPECLHGPIPEVLRFSTERACLEAGPRVLNPAPVCDGWQ